MRRKPWVAVTADRKQIGLHPFHAVGEKYLRALHDAADVQAFVLPALADASQLDDVLDEFDGLFFTGSPSNVEPHHYGAPIIDPEFPHDPARDATTLSLIPRAVEQRLPVLAVCRGLQEVNVALGGTLLQKVHEHGAYADHREDHSQPLDVQYGPAHAVHLAEGGLLRELAGAASVTVNSLHGQGIERPGRNLRVEATAPDGLIEAIRLDSPHSWLLALQWHPEWRVNENPFYRAIFQSFGARCRQRLASRT